MVKAKTTLFERRCTNCNALLFKAVIEVGKVECKCKCGTTNTIEAEAKYNDQSAAKYSPSTGITRN